MDYLINKEIHIIFYFCDKFHPQKRFTRDNADISLGIQILIHDNTTAIST